MTKQLAFVGIATAALIVTQMACSRTSSTSTASSSPGGAGFADSVCPAVAYVSNIQLTYTSASALPSQLAVSIDGNPVSFDTCSPALPISVEQTVLLTVLGSNQVQVSGILDASASLWSTYFTSSAQAPTNGSISYQLYGRANCTDPLQPIVNHQNLALSWQPVYSYGTSCGIYGYQSITSDSN